MSRGLLRRLRPPGATPKDVPLSAPEFVSPLATVASGAPAGSFGIASCVCCGASDLELTPILWPALIEEWRLSSYEADYVNRQQGLHCARCGSNLRSMALALALMRWKSFTGVFAEFVQQAAFRNLRILEINEVGSLTQFLSPLPGHALGMYPDVDMLRLPYADETFDVVVHSDTLEHVEQPVAGLAQCRRVLRPGGICAFTVPIIVDRMNASRAGLPPSYHDSAAQRECDFAVQTEYGCDAWKHVIQAGFAECRIVALDYPAAHALCGLR